MHSREETPLLVRAAVHDEIDRLGPDPAVIQEDRSLGRSAVGSDSLARLLDPSEQREQRVLQGRDSSGERAVVIDPLHSPPRLLIE